MDQLLAAQRETAAKSELTRDPSWSLDDLIAHIIQAANQQSIEIFPKIESNRLHLTVSDEVFPLFVEIVLPLLEDQTHLLLLNRLGKSLSLDQLRARTEPALFDIRSGLPQSSPDPSFHTIRLNSGPLPDVMAANEKWETEARFAAGQLVAEGLQRTAYAKGLNPHISADLDGRAIVAIEPWESSEFIKVLVQGAEKSAAWRFENAQGRELTGDLLLSRSTPADVTVYIKERIGHHTSEIPLEVKIKKKFQLPKNSAVIVSISDWGPCSLIASEIEQELELLSIPYVKGGSANHDITRINVQEEMLPVLKRIIVKRASGRSDVVILNSKGRLISESEFSDVRTSEPYDIAIVRQIAGTRVLLAIALEIAAWRDTLRPGNRFVATNRASRHVARIGSFKDIQSLSHLGDVTAGYRDPLDHSMPIDVVYTWVDDTDPVWVAARAKHSPQQSDMSPGEDDRGRYHNRDELKYSLRSIDMFAPFVRKIFIVTADQTPAWLDTSRADIEVISHKEIFRDRTALPTFNSHSIESQIHNIPGLSEHFIYFNDDMMLGQMCSPNDFFAANGVAYIRPEPLYIVPELLRPTDPEYLHAGANVASIMRAEFHTSPSNTMRHIPYSVRKSVLEEIHQKYPDPLMKTACSKFRSTKDVPPISFFYCHYAFQTGKAIDREASHRYIPLWSKQLSKTLGEVLNSAKYKFICLNDAGSLPDDREAAERHTAEFLERYYPFKSRFEK